mmetsp:Transcript_22116/g.29558  ORF Transcript_22116/g.29558 Transcript_22116/m.29558 type:complete len:242 (+) Transcript_22116:166-891(+)
MVQSESNPERIAIVLQLTILVISIINYFPLFYLVLEFSQLQSIKDWNRGANTAKSAVSICPSVELWENWLIVPPACLLGARVLVIGLFMIFLPKLNFERNIQVGLSLLYTFFIASTILSQLIFNNQISGIANLEYALLAVMVACSFLSTMVQFTLIKLVYILPDIYKWNLVSAEAFACVLAVLSLTPIFFTTAAAVHSFAWYFYGATLACCSVLFLIVGLKTIKVLANSEHTCEAISLFDR